MKRNNRPVIVHVVHALGGGGTERMLVALLRAFDRSRCRHVVATLREAGSLAAQLPDDVACRPLHALGRSPAAGFRLARVTRQWDAALIHARNTGCWHDAIVARLLTPRARLLLSFHGLESKEGFGSQQRRRARWALRAGGRFTTVSAAGRQQLWEEVRIPIDRIDLLPNGVDRSVWAPPDGATRRRMRASFGFDDKALVVGTVGSLTPVKDHATLISAVARAAKTRPDIHLLVVGDGPLRTSLIERVRAERLETRVRFAGWREDVPVLMACMDVYVCSSVSEGMSNALLEAMASGLPVIATRVGDNGIMVRDNVEGYVVEAASPNALAGALLKLADDPELRRRFAAAALARTRDYDFSQAVRRYEDYYRTLMGIRNVSGPE